MSSEQASTSQAVNRKDERSKGVGNQSIKIRSSIKRLKGGRPGNRTKTKNQ